MASSSPLALSSAVGVSWRGSVAVLFLLLATFTSAEDEQQKATSVSHQQQQTTSTVSETSASSYNYTSFSELSKARSMTIRIARSSGAPLSRAGSAAFSVDSSSLFVCVCCVMRAHCARIAWTARRSAITLVYRCAMLACGVFFYRPVGPLPSAESRCTPPLSSPPSAARRADLPVH